MHAALGNGSIVDIDVTLHGGDRCCRRPLSRQRIEKRRLRLCFLQAELRILYDDQRIALAHGSVFFKADFPDKALHAAVDGRNMTMHVSIVGKLNVSQVYELGNHINDAAQQKCDHNDIVYQYFCFSTHD